MPTEVSTIGYEGRTVGEFIQILNENNIKKLIDVREIPNSRKHGFSKNILSKAIGEVGIEYVHLPALGSPKDVRDKYRLNKDFGWFYARYSSYLNKLNGQFTELTEHVSEKNSCLMCYERQANKCHRSIITERLSSEGYSILHL